MPGGHFHNSRPLVLGALVRSLSRSERIRCTGNMLLCFWAFVYFTMCASMLLSEQFASVMIVSFLNQKGGVGKSTLSVNVAAYLAKKPRKVLLIDADTQ